MVGLDAYPFGCSLPLSGGWGFVTQLGGVHILLWGLLGIRRYWGMWSISRFFHPFKVNNLRERLGIMAILTAKGAREVFPKSVVILPLVLFVITPLGFFFP
jgi:hypothetical protein